jgi:hypothetical protein
MEVTCLQHYQSTLPYVHSYTPVQVPTDREQSIKVAYIDALEPYQTEDDRLWSSEDWGIYRFHVRDWFHEAPYDRMDLSEDDMRYHKFDVSNFHVFTFDDDNRAVIVWDDIMTRKTYCAESILHLNAGSKVK